jgi:hypothetical protein
VGSPGGTILTTDSDWGIAKYYTLINNTGSWIEQGTVSDKDGFSGYRFGHAVGVDLNGYVAIGSPLASVNNNISQGKVTFELFPSY